MALGAGVLREVARGVAVDTRVLKRNAGVVTDFRVRIEVHLAPDGGPMAPQTVRRANMRSSVTVAARLGGRAEDQSRVAKPA